MALDNKMLSREIVLDFLPEIKYSSEFKYIYNPRFSPNNPLILSLFLCILINKGISGFYLRICVAVSLWKKCRRTKALDNEADKEHLHRQVCRCSLSVFGVILT